MLFLAALLYSLLHFFIPGELLLVWLADGIASRTPLPWQAALAVLNLLSFSCCFAGLRMTHLVWREFTWEKGVLNDRLRDFIDVRHCRWLPLFAIAGIAACVAQLLVAGLLPFPFWFLFGAVLLGLHDVFGRRQLITIPLDLPDPVFDFDSERDWGGGAGEGVREISLQWRRWSGDDSGVGVSESETFYVSEEEYRQAKEKPRFDRRPLEEYARYVSEGTGGSVIEIAGWLRADAEAKGYTSIEEFMNAVNIVRGVLYKSDLETQGVEEYANFPIETLCELAGDCEDHAILAAALARLLGHDVALFWIAFKEDEVAHLAVGYCPEGGALPDGTPYALLAKNGRRYMYVETVPTPPDEMPGDIPQEFLSQLESGKVILLEPPASG